MIKMEVIAKTFEELSAKEIYEILKSRGEIFIIGRVLTLHHGQGMGRVLMERGVVYIKERMSCDKIVMDAQVHAIDFYRKFGFKVVSEEFLEEGVMHVKMERVL